MRRARASSVTIRATWVGIVGLKAFEHRLSLSFAAGRQANHGQPKSAKRSRSPARASTRHWRRRPAYAAPGPGRNRGRAGRARRASRRAVSTTSAGARSGEGMAQKGEIAADRIDPPAVQAVEGGAEGAAARRSISARLASRHAARPSMRPGDRRLGRARRADLQGVEDLGDLGHGSRRRERWRRGDGRECNRPWRRSRARRRVSRQPGRRRGHAARAAMKSR